MLPQVGTKCNWLTRAATGMAEAIVRMLSPPLPLVRPSLSQLAQPGVVLPRFVRQSAVACKYLDLLGPLDWDHFPGRDRNRAWPGPEPQPRAPYVASYLVKLNQHIRYMTDLRDFLVEHPALVWILGFPLFPSPAYTWGFDVEASLSCSRQFNRVLRTLDNDALQFLLDGTVTLTGQELPPEVLLRIIALGDVISGDTKHVIAWVKENNLKAYVEDRYDKTQQPSGDPDCRLGCKRKRNLGQPGPVETAATAAETPQAAPPRSGDPPPTPTTDPVPAKNLQVGEYYWGYASGVIATKVPEWCEIALAELTQPFDRSDASYFQPLMADVERRLGCRPRFGTFDAGFDAFYVYQYFHDAGGFAAVPFAERGGITRQFDANGLPLCSAGLPMPLKSTYVCHTTLVEHQRGRYACPLRFPQPSGQSCPIAHPNWDKGGCIVTMPTCEGARIRHQLDRDGKAYKEIYRQRTADERVNSQAVELGIERPKLRNGQAIANQNTLIYVLINLRAIQRIRAHKEELARQQEQARKKGGARALS
jgi:hypothetical protein